MSLFGHSKSKSLFGGGTASDKVSDPHPFDWGAAALSFMGVDPQMFIQRRRQKAEEEQQAQTNAIIDADPSLSPQDKAYAKLNPKAYLDNYMQRFQPMNTGPGGGSRGLPGPGGQIASWQTAPRFDDNGTIYAPGTGTSAPQVLQRGTKAVPIQQGGHVDILDSITGRPMAQDGSVMGLSGAPPSPPTQNTFQPGQVVNGFRLKGGDDTDPRNWEPVGGAGRSGPPTFPQ